MRKQGLAKTQFIQTYPNFRWQENAQKPLFSWPLLTHLLEERRLTYLDYLLVHRILRNYRESSENVALFLCHLILATKEGHLCIKIKDNTLLPSVDQLWLNDDGLPLKIENAQILSDAILKGISELPAALNTSFDSSLRDFPYTPICQHHDRFYLQKYWIFESSFLSFFWKFLKQEPTLHLDQRTLKTLLDDLVFRKILLQEQANAIESGCTKPLTLITGGPGTGKTYTAGHLIRVFWSLLTKEQHKVTEIVLAAPTGKAAANLQKSLSKEMEGLENFPTLHAKTLHSLLGIKNSHAQTASIRLSADLIVVDESSMIDVKVMGHLFESLKPGARLILLGDEYQLPSVEAGSVFADLIQFHKKHSDLGISCVHLKKCLRAELKSLIDFAQLVNLGQADEVMHLLNEKSTEGIKRLQFSNDIKQSQKEFVEHILHNFPTIVKETDTPEYLLKIFHEIRVLSPLRKGLLGVEGLNELIWKKICQRLPSSGWLAVPIMINTNDYKQELFNGETGVLIRKLPLQPLSLEDYALFPSRQAQGEIRRQAVLLLPRYELAYCLSVHKSQGSEFNQVILALPEGSELFGREVFYTAVTRAKKKIEIFGSDHVLLKTIQQRGIRLSGIQERLFQISHL